MCVDDTLTISMKSKNVMEDIKQRFRFNYDKVEDPSSYLVAQLQKRVIIGWDCWTVTRLDYVKAAVTTVQKAIKKTTRQFPNKIRTPMAKS